LKSSLRFAISNKSEHLAFSSDMIGLLDFPSSQRLRALRRSRNKMTDLPGGVSPILVRFWRMLLKKSRLGDERNF
jgi:hypothetical protein